MKEDTIPALFQARKDSYKDRTFLKFKKDGEYSDLSWDDVGDKVEALTCVLISFAVKPKDKVAILSENRPEWVIADLAVLSCGAVTVPIYPTETPEAIKYILNDSQTKIIFVSTKEQADKIKSIKNNIRLLQKIIVFDEYKYLDKKADLAVFQQRWQQVKKNDTATLIYTSGTTGRPKGVMLSHENLLSDCRFSAEAIPVNETDLYLSFLPLSHVFERMAGYYLMMMKGATIAYAEAMDTVPQNMKEVLPTLMCGVPRFYEKVYAKIMENIQKASIIKKGIFFWGLRVGKRNKKSKKDKKGVNYAIANRILFKKIRKALGAERIKFFISGGAPLSKDVAEFFCKIGLVILEGYGLTETSAAATVNKLDDFKIGTVGKALPGVELKIAKDGEILIKGKNIMQGYYHGPEATEKALKDGWLYTGDIGYITAGGFLVITGRKKDIIVTSGGKNIAPQKIENLLQSDRYLAQVLVYGDKKNYLTALIVPDFEQLFEYAKFKNIRYKEKQDLIDKSAIIDFIKRRIEKASVSLARYENIKKFKLLDKEFTLCDGEVTPTLKIKRKIIVEKYKKLLDGMY